MSNYYLVNFMVTWRVSCHTTTWVNSAVHLPVWDWFTFSNMAPVCFCTFRTCPLLFLYVFHSPEVTIVLSPFLAVFFIADISANVVILTWVSLFLTIHSNLSKFTGAVRLPFVFAVNLHPGHNNTVYICHPIIFLRYGMVQFENWSIHHNLSKSTGAVRLLFVFCC